MDGGYDVGAVHRGLELLGIEGYTAIREYQNKILYLAMTDITKKWTGKTWDWGQTLDQLCIYFGDRIQPEDLE